MKYLLLSLSLGIGSAIIAQTTNDSKVDFYFGVGFMGSPSQQLTIPEYRTVLPESPILNKDLSHLNQSKFTYFNSSPLFHINYGFRLSQNEKTEVRLRVGISYRNYTSDNSAFYFQNSSSFDTLTSSQTGEETYVDSSYSESLFIDYYGEQIGLDVSYLVALNPNGRWSFYTGIGVEAGMSFNNRLDMSHSSYWNTSINEQFYIPFSNDFNQNFRDFETYKQDNTFYGRVYAPIGLDFRLSKKHEFWKRVHLFTELRPMLEFKNNALKEVQFNPGFGWSTLGLRVQF